MPAASGRYQEQISDGMIRVGIRTVKIRTVKTGTPLDPFVDEMHVHGSWIRDTGLSPVSSNLITK